MWKLYLFHEAFMKFGHFIIKFKILELLTCFFFFFFFELSDSRLIAEISVVFRLLKS